MQKLKGFPAFGSHTVGFEVDLPDADGNVTKWPVEHIFREPNAEDKKAYFQVIAELQVIDPDSGEGRLTQGDLSVAAAVLYDRVIDDVKGYDFGGKRPKEWTKNIAAEHKRWSIDRLIRNVGSLSVTTEKN